MLQITDEELELLVKEAYTHTGRVPSRGVRYSLNEKRFASASMVLKLAFGDYVYEKLGVGPDWVSGFAEGFEDLFSQIFLDQPEHREFVDGFKKGQMIAKIVFSWEDKPKLIDLKNPALVYYY